MTDPSKIKVRCGDWDQKDDDIEIIKHQDVAVKGISVLKLRFYFVVIHQIKKKMLFLMNQKQKKPERFQD